MLKWGRWATVVLALSLVMLVLAACGKDKNNGEAEGPDEVIINTDPVSVNFVRVAGPRDEESFQKLVVEPVKNKYPHITVNQVSAANPQELENLVVSRTQLDVVQFSIGNVATAQSLELLGDLNPLIRKYNFNMEVLRDDVQSGLQTIFSDELLGLPTDAQYQVLYYNKDIFDNFGVPYPKDGMTWDEIPELARTLTRMDNEVQYLGFGFDTGHFFQNNQLSMGFVDRATDRPLVNSDEWRNFLTAFLNIFEATGRVAPTLNDFVRNGNVAMFGAAANGVNNLVQSSFDWDLVTVPTFPQKPNTTMQLNTNFLGVAPTSPSQEAAFLVIEVMLDTEMQILNARNGSLSVLKDPQINAQFAVELPHMQGKNLEAIYKYSYAAPLESTRFDGDVRGLLIGQFNAALRGEIDINTALRQAEEAALQRIEQIKNR